MSGVENFYKKVGRRSWLHTGLSKQRFCEHCERLRRDKGRASSILVFSNVLKELLFSMLAHVSNDYGRHGFRLLTSGLGVGQKSILIDSLGQSQVTNG